MLIFPTILLYISCVCPVCTRSQLKNFNGILDSACCVTYVSHYVLTDNSRENHSRGSYISVFHTVYTSDVRYNFNLSIYLANYKNEHIFFNSVYQLYFIFTQIRNTTKNSKIKHIVLKKKRESTTDLLIFKY